MRLATALVAVALLGAGPALAQVALPSAPSQVALRVPFQPVATVYAEDFELGDGGFVAGGNASWQYGTPTVHVQPGIGQGPNVWGTNLAGMYENRVCGWVESPAIDLTGPPGAQTGVSAARVVFRHWLQAENQWDGGVVQASSDGVTWTTLAGDYDDRMIASYVRECLGVEIGEPVYTGPSGSTLPASDAWSEAELDLTAFLGGPVHLRWVFATDSSDVRLGWYVDDVQVQLGAGAFVNAPLPQVDPAAGVAFTPVATLYSEDFEVSDGGWTENGSGAWQWGEALAPPLPPPSSLAMWGTRLLGDYEPNECSYLTSPVVSLPGADAGVGVEAARLSFQAWRHLRSGYDAVQLQVSADDGATWAALVPYNGTYDRTLTSTASEPVRDCLGIGTSDRVWSGPFSEPKAEDWMDVQVDLTPYLGQDVRFRLAFGSGASGVVERGFYLGDVLVQVGVGGGVDAENPPVPALVAPGWSVAGTRPSWEYGLAQSGPFSSRPVWATNLRGGYHDGECSAIVSDPIDASLIPGLGRLSLSFEHMFSSESFYDGGVVQVSRDGGETWSLVTPFTGYPSSLATDADNCLGIATTARGFSGNPTDGEYVPVEISLASYQTDSIRIRFAFATDVSGTSLGWYVRNIGLSRGAGSVPLAMAVEGDVAEKIDVSLRAPLLAGDERIEAIVTGFPHEGLAGFAVADRAHGMETLEALAAPFLTGVAMTTESNGGEVVALWPSAPAAKVVVDRDTLMLLASREDVRGVAADAPDAVRLVDPVAGSPEDEGLGAQNTEGRQMLQAEEIWGAGFRGEGIKLSIIDTGIDATHEAFRNADGSSRVSAWVDFVGNGPTPYDDQGHGTHVAGTAAGSADWAHPTRGVYTQVGVAPEATLLVAKFLNSGGSGSFANAIESLEWSYEQGADITSNSWGSSGCSSGSYAVMQSVRTLTDLGMLSVFAAGNSGPGSGSIGAPACSESALSVGAVGSNGVIASFSSRGPCTDGESGGSSRICPDVVAKGYLVLSAAASGGCSLCSANGYRVLNGTSMATPHAAGAAVLIEQMKRAYTGAGWDTAARAEEEVLKLTTLDLGNAGEDNTYGWGLPQLLNVLALLESTDEARVVAGFGASKALLRQGDSAALTFSVRNLGAAVASGTFTASLVAPDGIETILHSSTPSLALLDGESYRGTFTVTNAVPIGNYTFRGRFDFSWTNGSSGEVHTDSILREAVMEVKRVDVQVELEGLPPTALPLSLQDVTYTARNVGNEDALRTRIEFTVPDDYVFVPGEGYDPLVPNTRYASPAPSSVIEDSQYGRVTLVFDVGNLTQGDSFSFTTRLMPTTPGQYRVLSVAKFFDGADNPFSQGAARSQTVGVAAP